MRRVLHILAVLIMMSAFSHAGEGDVQVYSYKAGIPVATSAVPEFVLWNILSFPNAVTNVVAKDVTPDQLSEIHKALLNFLWAQRINCDHGDCKCKQIDKVLFRLHEYHIQYCGVMVDGVAVVHIRGSYAKCGDPHFDGDLVYVDGGGADYWSVNYYLDEEEFRLLEINQEF